jgi:hypothetical protein
MTLRLLFACLLAVTVHPTTSWAWSFRGHWIIGLVAYEYIAPATRERVERILGEKGYRPFMYAAYPGDLFAANRRWHFVDIPPDASGYTTGSAYCPDYACAVEKMKELTVAAADKPSFGTKWALEYVFNLMGDIHQPVYVINAGDDHGENLIVRLDGHRQNLRDLWDRTLVDAAFGPDVKRAAAELIKEISPEKRQAWCAGSPDEWTSETFRIARDIAYGPDRRRGTYDNPLVLPPTYEEEAKFVVREQIAKAGVRLACWLDANLK